ALTCEVLHWAPCIQNCNMAINVTGLVQVNVCGSSELPRLITLAGNRIAAFCKPDEYSVHYDHPHHSPGRVCCVLSLSGPHCIAFVACALISSLPPFPRQIPTLQA